MTPFDGWVDLDGKPAPVGWLIELRVAADNGCAFRSLAREIADAERGVLGTFWNGWLATDDGGLVHAMAVYADADAACAHLEVLQGQFGVRLFELATAGSCFVYGSATPRMLALLAPLRRTWLPRPLAIASPFIGFEGRDGVPRV